MDLESDFQVWFMISFVIYVSQSTLEIYKQWVADGKKIPLEDIIQIATKLICSGVNGLDI